MTVAADEIAARVSIVIIFLNAGAFIQQAIDSIVQQSFESWEIVLVDDGSKDESSRIAKAAADQRPGQIRYFEHQGHENLGTSVSRELGLQVARGEYLLYLDADDILFTGALATLCGLADAHPDMDAVFGTTLWWNWAPEFAGGDDGLQSYGSRLGRFDPPDFLSALTLNENLHPANCSSFFRRRTLIDVGGFEPEFRGMYEDTVLLAKVLLHSAVLVTSEAFSAYRMHPASQCHRAAADGSYHRSKPNEARGRYLRWLKRFKRKVRVRNTRLDFAVMSELWAYDRPYLFRAARSRKLHRTAGRAKAILQKAWRHESHAGGDNRANAQRAAIARAALAQALDAQGQCAEADVVRSRAARSASRENGREIAHA